MQFVLESIVRTHDRDRPRPAAGSPISTSARSIRSTRSWPATTRRAHVNDDFFKNKLAFIVLLNFPITTLEQRLTEGEKWSRRQWAEAALGLTFSKRIPSEVNLAVGKASADASQYVATYNIWMHHLLDDKGKRLFPAKMRLLEHWNLRDEIKANYSLDPKVGLAEAAHGPARDGAHRRPDHPRGRRRQPERRLESVHERSESRGRRRRRRRRRTSGARERSPTSASPTRATRRSSSPSRPRSSSIPTRPPRRRTSGAASRKGGRCSSRASTRC